MSWSSYSASGSPAAHLDWNLMYVKLIKSLICLSSVCMNFAMWLLTQISHPFDDGKIVAMMRKSSHVLWQIACGMIPVVCFMSWKYVSSIRFLFCEMMLTISLAAFSLTGLSLAPEYSRIFLNTLRAGLWRSSGKSLRSGSEIGSFEKETTMSMESVCLKNPLYCFWKCPLAKSLKLSWYAFVLLSVASFGKYLASVDSGGMYLIFLSSDSFGFSSSSLVCSLDSSDISIVWPEIPTERLAFLNSWLLWTGFCASSSAAAFCCFSSVFSSSSLFTERIE